MFYQCSDAAMRAFNVMKTDYAKGYADLKDAIQVARGDTFTICADNSLTCSVTEKQGHVKMEMMEFSSNKRIGKLTIYPTHVEFNNWKGLGIQAYDHYIQPAKIWETVADHYFIPFHDSFCMLGPSSQSGPGLALKEDPKDAGFVDQGYFTAWRLGPGRSHLKTLGVASCLAVSLFDKKKKVGSLAHIEIGTNMYQTLQAMKDDMKAAGMSGKEILLNAAGGKESYSESTIVNLALALRSHKLRLSQSRMLSKSFSGNVVFDLVTGEMSQLSRDVSYGRFLRAEGSKPNIRGLIA